MKNLVLCVTLNFLFFINIVYSAVTPVNTTVHFVPKQSFKLECNFTYDGNDPPKIQWTKGSQAVTSIDSLKNRAKAKWDDSKKINILTVTEARDGDTGNYSCAVLDDKGQIKEKADLTASRTIAVKVPTNINVVEEEKLTVECKVVGSPRLYWMFKNETYEESRDRIILANYSDDGQHIENGLFIIEKVEKDDRGNVTCVGVDIYNSSITEMDVCMIRIKDKYAALWPFLGICAEVIVLCAIIIIYEKKRNKTELDESDTDQSPDQKNTPDHGKEANLRHRQ